MKIFTTFSLLAVVFANFFNNGLFFSSHQRPCLDYTLQKSHEKKEPQATSIECGNWLRIPNYNTQDYVSIGDLDITGNQITVEASFNADTNYFVAGTVSYDLVSKHTGTSDCNYLLRPLTGEITTTNGFYQVIACDYIPKKINHAALVYDGTTLKFYRNGFLMASKPASGNLVTNDLITKIGNYAFGSQVGALKGYMNEVRIWNIARTQDEIKTYMNASLPNPTNQAGLVAYYTFDNLANKQGNSAWNGTLHGDATISNTVPDCTFTADTCGGIVPNNCGRWLRIPNYNTQDYAAIGDLDVSGNQITVEASFSADTNYFVSGTVSYDLVSKHATPADCNYLLRPVTAEISTSNGYYQVVACDYVPKKINHAALVYDGTTLKFYRNGYLMGSKPASGNLVTNDLVAKIGNFALGNEVGALKGYMNEVRIWNVARTQQQIRDYMNISLPDPATQTGLLAYYTFDNLLNKQGNSAWNATLHGAASINNFVADCNFIADSCQVNNINCGTWLKTPDKLTGVSIGELDITGNQMTIEAMCNASDIYDLSRALVSKHGWQANCNYFLCPDLAQITTTDGFFSASSPCSFVSNKTYHVAMVYNGSSLRLYRNGFLMQEVPATGNLITNNWPATIGEYAYAMFFNDAGISNIFKGYINEVRIWNVARTQQQISDYMNTSLPNPASQAGLLGYYTFDGLNNKQGNTLYDGTLRGTATINNTNPECSFVADSCTVTTPCSSNWLIIPNSNSYATCGEIDIPGNQLTIEGWCARDSALTPEGYTSLNVVSKHFTPADVNYLLRIDRAQVTTTQGHFVTPEICLTENKKTYHVAMVYDGSDLKFYRNGFLMSQIACTGNLIQNNWLTTIGATAGNPTTNTTLIGYINEVRIWNVARTQQQIKDFLGGSLPNPTTQPGLLAYYSYGDLTNRQGNSLYNGLLHGNAVISSANPNCNLAIDTCLTVVPVTLTDFRVFATAQNNIQLDWRTAQESGLFGYIIERSISANGQFTTIGIVDAKNSAVGDSYTFHDKTARPNTRYFYRLRIVETSGSKRYSPVKDALFKANGLFVNIYPNPAKSILLVYLTNASKPSSISIYNDVGQLVIENKVMLNGTINEINIDKLTRGTYWVQITSGEDRVIKKIAKL